MDPALVREALRIVAACGGVPRDDQDGASRAALAGSLRFLRQYGGSCFVDAEEMRDVHRAVARAVLDLPTEVVEELAEEVGPWVELAARDYGCLVFDADVLLRLWELGLERSRVESAVEHYLENGDLPRLRERAEASDREDLFDEMVDAALPSCYSAFDRELSSAGVLIDVVLRRWDDAALLAAYREGTTIWANRSAFLDRMIATGVAARPGLRRAAESLEWKLTHEEQTAKAWLLDAIDRASVAASSAPSEADSSVGGGSAAG